MKLESFKDKKITRRKMVLLSLGVIIIVGVSLLLYKTFAKFSSEVSFPLMSGKVNYYGDSDIIFGFYNGEQELDKMPQKGNPENLAFDHAVCDNGASVEWNEKEWGPVVLNLTKTKTRCTLYFSEKKITGVDYLEEKAQEEQTKEEPELMYDDTEDRNLRYVGSSPNNYIDIGDRDSDGNPILWRIIGVMKNVYNDESGSQEDLIKIIRADNIGQYSWDTSEGEVNNSYGVNEWSQADLMKLLNPDSVYTKSGEIGNSLYWNSESGQCYSDMNNINQSCDFASIGISEEARERLAKVRWNTGTFATKDNSEWTASATYQAERGNIDGKQYCTSQGGGYECNDNVERTTTWDGYIGLMNASDFGYAVGKSVRKICLAKSMYDYTEDGCTNADWLKPSNSREWILNPAFSDACSVFNLFSDGYLSSADIASNSRWVRPVGFLKSSTTISEAAGTPEDPFIAS